MFDEYAARVFGLLYESFPAKRRLDTRRLTGHADEDEKGTILSPDGRPSKDVEVAWATIEWLVETGYIRSKDSYYLRSFSGCVLTAEGLRLLKRTPDSVALRESAGDKLSRMVREGALDLAKDVLKGLFA